MRGKSGVRSYIVQIYIYIYLCERVNISISCGVNDIRRQRMSYAVWCPDLLQRGAGVWDTVVGSSAATSWDDHQMAEDSGYSAAVLFCHRWPLKWKENRAEIKLIKRQGFSWRSFFWVLVPLTCFCVPFHRLSGCCVVFDILCMVCPFLSLVAALSVITSLSSLSKIVTVVLPTTEVMYMDAKTTCQ